MPSLHDQLILGKAIAEFGGELMSVWPNRIPVIRPLEGAFLRWPERAATGFCGVLAQQHWLDDVQRTIAQIPDWALSAVATAFALQFLLLVFALAPRLRRRHSEGGSPELQPARRTSGVPDDDEQERMARVFVSSTFRDMQAEREALATYAFPALKQKFRARGVELQEVDLRWGVNEGDPTLDICLAAVRRSNWFVGLIGQRYGTTLKDEAKLAQLRAEYPSIRDGLSRSLTELEMREGVLSGGDKQVLVFERDASWLHTLDDTQRALFEEQDEAAQRNLTDLKTRLRDRVGAFHHYASPQEIGAVFESKMTEALERAYPPIDGPDDPAVQEHRRHAAYARERRGLYVGGDAYLSALDAWIAGDAAPMLVAGASGAGKSALVANWSTKWARANPNDIVFAHYLDASPDSANPNALARRLFIHLNAVTGDEAAPPNADATADELRAALFRRLAGASSFAARESCRIVLAIDGLDKLADENGDLRWLPRNLPARVRLLASSLDGRALEAARERGWTELLVKPFDADRQGEFIAETLKSWNKSDFPEARKHRMLSHPLAGLPLFLKAILEELRVSAANDVLDARLDAYLQASNMPDVFARILGQIEAECGRALVARTLSLVWASRAGLEEDEIVAIDGCTNLAWERLRNRLAGNLRDVSGRITFSHEYLRHAVELAYCRDDETKAAAHLAIADRFAARDLDGRQVEEVPYQLQAAKHYEKLSAYLLDLNRLPALRARGDRELSGYWSLLRDHGFDPGGLLCDAVERANPADVQCWSHENCATALSAIQFLQFAAFGTDRPLALLRRLVTACERCFGKYHPKTEHAVARLAGHYHSRMSDAKNAERATRRWLDIQKRMYGPRAPETASSYNNLASLLENRGRYGAAESLYKTAIAITKRTYGENSPELIKIYNNYAALLANTHRVEASENLFRKALAICETNELDHDERTATTLNQLAHLIDQLGGTQEAVGLLWRAVKIKEEVFGPDTLDVAHGLNNLAFNLFAIGEVEHAASAIRHAIMIYERTLGADAPETQNARDGLRALLSRPVRDDVRMLRSTLRKINAEGRGKSDS